MRSRVAQSELFRLLELLCGFYSPVQWPSITAFTVLVSSNSSTPAPHRRTPLFLSICFRRCFVQGLEEVRQEWHFLLIGWVLMPEHFHVLIEPQPTETHFSDYEGA